MYSYISDVNLQMRCNYGNRSGGEGNYFRFAICQAERALVCPEYKRFVFGCDKNTRSDTRLRSQSAFVTDKCRSFFSNPCWLHWQRTCFSERHFELCVQTYKYIQELPWPELCDTHCHYRHNMISASISICRSFSTSIRITVGLLNIHNIFICIHY